MDHGRTRSKPLYTIAAILIPLVLSPPARADEAPPKDPPLVGVEASVAGGIELGGGAGATAVRYAPVTASVLAEIAIIRQPWVTFWGKAYVEVLDRAGFGLAGGLRLRPFAGKLRLGIGFQGVVEPYTAAGGEAHGGMCWKPKGLLRLCADLEAVALFLGNDIPDGKVAVQLQAVLSLGFDAL